MKIIILSSLLYFVSTFSMSASAYGNNFSCPIGTTGSCLSYGDKIVDQNSSCFDSYTCNYKGFICKSKFDDIAEEYDDLLNKCTAIAQDFDEMSDAHNRLITEHHNMKECVTYAGSLDEAQACAW